MLFSGAHIGHPVTLLVSTFIQCLGILSSRATHGR